MATLIDDANHVSFVTRAHALEKFASLSAESQREKFAALLKSSYKDVREGVLEILDAETLNADPAWMEAVIELVDSDPVHELCLCIGILALLSRFESKLPKRCLEFGEACLDTDNDDLTYQAAYFLETQCDERVSYSRKVIQLLDSPDEEIRIIAVQALTRLRLGEAIELLDNCAQRAVGIEAFHILLARLELGNAEKRGELEPELIRHLWSDKYCYPTVVALKKYGTSNAIQPLLVIANGKWTEPTLRIAAAEAAATLGSVVGIQLLQQFAKKSGNCAYAKEALKAFEGNEL